MTTRFTTRFAALAQRRESTPPRYGGRRPRCRGARRPARRPRSASRSPPHPPRPRTPPGDTTSEVRIVAPQTQRRAASSSDSPTTPNRQHLGATANSPRVRFFPPPPPPSAAGSPAAPSPSPPARSASSPANSTTAASSSDSNNANPTTPGATANCPRVRFFPHHRHRQPLARQQPPPNPQLKPPAPGPPSAAGNSGNSSAGYGYTCGVHRDGTHHLLGLQLARADRRARRAVHRHR